MRLRMRFARYAPGKIHVRRNRIRKALKTAPYTSNMRKWWSRIASSTYGSCSPISTNTSPLRMKVRESQTAHACSRTLGLQLPYVRSEEHTSELQSRPHLVCRLLLEKKKHTTKDEFLR